MLLPNFGRLNIEAASAAVPAVASAAAAAAGANERTDDCLADSTRTKLCPTKERKCATSPSTTTAKATACVHVGAVGAARVLERERDFANFNLFLLIENEFLFKILRQTFFQNPRLKIHRAVCLKNFDSRFRSFLIQNFN